MLVNSEFDCQTWFQSYGLKNFAINKSFLSKINF